MNQTTKTPWWRYAIIADAHVLPAVLGVVAGWAPLDLFLLYWLQTSLAGFWAVARAMAHGLPQVARPQRATLFVGAFVFVLLYVFLMAFVGIQVFQLFTDPDQREHLGWGEFDNLLLILRHLEQRTSVLISLAVLFIADAAMFATGLRKQGRHWLPRLVLSRLVVRMLAISLLLMFAQVLMLSIDNHIPLLVATVLCVTGGEVIALRWPHLNPLDWLKQSLSPRDPMES